MKKVIVFGAGTSASFGVPTMDKFIDVAEDLRISSPSALTAPHFDLFFDVVRNRFRQLHAKSAVNLDNIESVFGLVEMARVLRRLPGFEPSQIEELAAAIRTVLLETIVLSGTFEYSREQGWLPPRHHLSVAGYFDRQAPHGQADDISLITFNYDLALDFALHWSSLKTDYGFGPPQRDSVHLLKLHGSLNWVTCSKCRAVRVIPMDRIFQAYAGRRSLDRASIQLSLDPRRAHSALGPHCPGDDSPFEITIVPPSWNKTQYWQQLSAVWSAAARELASAQEIIVVGYSLPESDSFFRDLMALGLEGPTRVRAFRVVNPDKDVAARFERLLGPELRGRFVAVTEKFEDWADNTFGAAPRIDFLR